MFWTDCVLHSTYLINRTPTPILNNQTPFKILYKRIPLLDHFRVFGSQCFISPQSQHLYKFDPRALECVFLGYPTNTKGFRVYDLNSKQIIVSRIVCFNEKCFPFANNEKFFNTHTHQTFLDDWETEQNFVDNSSSLK